MDFTVEWCLKAVIKNDADEFELLLLRIKQFITKVRNFAAPELKWVQDIPVFCTLCNNHKFLKKFRVQLKSSCNFKPSSALGNELSVVDLANALEFRKCKEHLVKLYGISIDGSRDKHQRTDFYIIAGILNVGKLYNIDQSVVIQCIHRLVENGLDIHARGPGNRTILHETVLKMCTYRMFKTLFSLGCDVNSTDDFGATAFLLFIWKAYHYKGRSQELVRTLTLFLYQNPDTSVNTCIVQKAMHYDRMRFPDEEEISDDEVTDNTCRKHMHPKEHLRLLPWLYKCGFRITQQDRDMIESPNLFSRPVTYNLSLNNPRSLKDTARLVIRATYPGRRLHKVINSITVPASVRDYILMEFLNIEP